MNRAEAIALRERQLAGNPVDQVELAAALVILQVPARRTYKPRLQLAPGVRRPPGLLAARARANDVLLRNLTKARA